MTRKTAFVLGGSKGIGAEIVRTLAVAGHDVAFTYNSSTDLAAALCDELRAAGLTCFCFRADVRDLSSVPQAIAKSASQLGHINILINNAGILKRGKLQEFDLLAFDEIFNVNVRGPFIASQAVLPFMPNGGRILMMGSVAADRSAIEGSAFYAATKAALSSMARGFARDVAPLGITVNTIQPGVIETNMVSPGALSRDAYHAIPAGRKGLPSDVANLVRFLVSDESSYITGTSLNIDGGYLA
ncbi:SDR family oxidoreductase (plasmid) [Agrobacterium tumefaciens]|uniref:SDR family oxidoreductase n=1 Tax=Agrobacterium tumefaciens TaxID=358 RepID=A0AAE6BHQ4_AGRTU|nr:SDR family oxidoreductase [Agrobacterium tumefaciens]QCL82898.1 SDR family oxidoreductase [Agrobacterium tumefaciens]